VVDSDAARIIAWVGVDDPHQTGVGPVVLEIMVGVLASVDPANDDTPITAPILALTEIMRCSMDGCGAVENHGFLWGRRLGYSTLKRRKWQV